MSVGEETPADRRAATLAVLRVNYDEGEGELAGYVPFVLHVIRDWNPSEPISNKAVAEALGKEFSLELPLGVIRSILEVAEAKGELRREKDLLFPGLGDRSGGLDQRRGEFARQFGTLAASVAEFAGARHTLVWSSEVAKAALLTYVDQFSSDLLAAALDGKALPSTPPHQVSPDQFVVHEFALWCAEADAQSFEFLVSLVKARMLEDALYLNVIQGQDSTLSGVRVLLDGPILLRLLGYAGPELAAPYKELLELLAAQGAVVGCFHHSIVEAQGVLDAAAAQKGGGVVEDRFYGDVVGYLVRSSISRSEIEVASDEIEKQLERCGVSVIDPPSRSVSLQPDEEEIGRRIEKNIPNIRRPALVRDIDSLVAIHNWRAGKPARTLATCKAVLVTHNYALFRASSAFFRDRPGKHVPHCVYDSSFTTAVWLRSPRSYPDLPRERVLADAAAALQPAERLWRRYNDVLQRLRGAGEISDEELAFLRYSSEASRLLMASTRGDASAVTDGSVAALLAEHRRRLVAEERGRADDFRTRAEASEARELGTRTTLVAQREKIAAVAARRGRRWANGLVGVLSVLLIVGSILPVLAPAGWQVPWWVGLPLLLVPVFVGLWGDLSGGDMRRARDLFSRALADRIERRLLVTFGPTDTQGRDDDPLG